MRRYKVLIILLSLVFLVGQSCDFGGSSGGGDSEEDNLRGTEGLILEFVEGLPPEEVWKGIEFGIWLDVHNMGLNPIRNGRVCIGSLPSSIFSKSDSCLELGEIEGRRTFPGGEIKTFGEGDWEGFSVSESYEVNADTEYPISARVCYEGSTSASPLVCVRDLRVNNADAVCEAGDIDINSGGQGAPVSVTAVKEDIIPRGSENELLFTITVKNSDDGEVLRREAVQGDDDCVFDRQDKDKVKIEVELPGFGVASCRNNGEIIMVNGEGQTVCSGIRVPRGDNFALPLNIKLNYGYVSRLKGEFTIKKDIVEA